MRRNFYNLSVLTKRLPFQIGCGLFSACSLFLTNDADVTGLSQDCHRTGHGGWAGSEISHYGWQARSDATAYSIDYQYYKPSSFVTDEGIDRGVDRPF